MYNSDSRIGIKRNNNGSYKVLSKLKNPYTETANIGSGFNNGGSTLTVSAIGASARENKDLILTGLLNDNQTATLRLFYKDIYLYDPIGGSAVDMGSSLPFSDFSLHGLDSEKLDIFQSSIERLDMKNKNSMIYANRQVYGEFISTLVYNKRDKMFVDMLEHDLNHCTMQYLPFSSMEPSITVKSDSETNKFLNSNEEHLVKMRKHIPEALLESMRQGDYILDPLTTLYLARYGINRKQPTSYFQRLLPIYLLEKSMLRGTITEVNKRQRAFLHAVCGDDNWEPTAEELAEVTATFQKADLDPLGPVISTRQGIQLTESRQGGDFFKYTDIVDITTPLKYKALSISEGFLTGESNYATAETNLSVYMESLKSERSAFTQNVYYNKIFPTISAVHKFYDEGAKKSASSHNRINDTSKLLIPQLHWHKSLEPINDDKVMEILEKLEEKGIPITLSMWAAAGGMEIEDFEQELPNDLKHRKLFADYAQKVQETIGAGEEDYDDETASLKIKPKLSNIFKRNYAGLQDIYNLSPTGKKKHIINQSKAKEKLRNIIVKANRALSDKSHYTSVVKDAKRKNLLP